MMKITFETRDFEVVVRFEGVQVTFDNMQDAQAFVIEILKTSGKIGY